MCFMMETEQQKLQNDIQQGENRNFESSTTRWISTNSSLNSELAT